MNESNEPIIISIVSGKGGCGKTRIATALARFLSQRSNVLLIDMDIHNQGLTTLLKQEIKDKNYTAYGLLDLNSDYLENSKDPIKANENVFFIPAINQNTTINLKEIEKELTSNKIANKLKGFISLLAEKFQIKCVIIDNTGLPDAFSIGSALCSDRVLIITQPESISWQGALNFYTVFKRNGGKETINFIVNNIPKRYTSTTVKGLFGFDFNFLAFIPFEYGLLESFGRDPFKDEFLTYTQFYQKIGYIGTYILKQMKRKDIIPEEEIEKYTDSIRDDLTEKYTASLTYEESLWKFLRNFTASSLLIVSGAAVWFYGVGLYRFEYADIFKLASFLLIIIAINYYITSAGYFKNWWHVRKHTQGKSQYPDQV